MWGSPPLSPLPRSCWLSGLCGAPRKHGPPLSQVAHRQIGLEPGRPTRGIWAVHPPRWGKPHIPSARNAHCPPYFLRLKSKVLYFIMPSFTWLLLPPVPGSHRPGVSPSAGTTRGSTYLG